jgi:hypothetical protein
MRDEMGTFRVDIELENPARPGPRRTLTSNPTTKQLVDAGPAPAAVAA